MYILFSLFSVSLLSADQSVSLGKYMSRKVRYVMYTSYTVCTQNTLILNIHNNTLTNGKEFQSLTSTHHTVKTDVRF